MIETIYDDSIQDIGTETECRK